VAGFKPHDPDYKAVVRSIFEDAPFIRALGAELVALEPGHCESGLDLRADHFQQDGFVHAGVQATLADHTAGCAAATLMPPGVRILTVEFKINLLRAAAGNRLVCRGRVLRPGKAVTVAESELFAAEGGSETLCAKAMVTLALTRATS
jgi:uncharacterized protein (TIGR00369 family)